MVLLHFAPLMRLVEFVSANHLEDYQFFNTFIENGEYKSYLEAKPIVPPHISIDDIAPPVMQLAFDPATLTDAEKHTMLVKAIEIYCANNNTEYNHNADKDDADKKLLIVWAELQKVLAKEYGCGNIKKLKPSKWRQVLKNIGVTANSIDRIKWQR